MPTNNKKSVSTPLHLLQQLSHSLLEHLEKACTQALVDAEELLTKLEKQRVKAQEKLHDARSKLQDAAKAGKAKAQEKPRPPPLSWKSCSPRSRPVRPKPAATLPSSSVMLRKA